MGIFGGSQNRPQWTTEDYGNAGMIDPETGGLTGSGLSAMGYPDGQPQGATTNYAGLAKAAGSATQTLVGLIGASRKRRLEKQAERIQGQERKEQFDESMKNSLDQEGDTLRGYDRALPEANAQMSARGLENSSAKNDSLADMAYTKDRQLNGIQRARMRLRHGYEAGEKLHQLQKKMDRIQQQEATIAAGIDTAVSVASIASDVNLKKGFRAVNAKEVAAKVAELGITEWRYKADPYTAHLGPMAQDFRGAFGLGDSDRKIDVVDGLGVALAAIKGLHQMVREQAEMIVDLNERLMNHAR